jgi:hypothetical protein
MTLQIESLRLVMQGKQFRLLFALIALSSALSCGDQKDVVARLAIPESGEIVILTDSYYENSRMYYYEIVASGENKVPTTVLCGGDDPEKFRFEVVLGQQGNIVGLVENKRPGEVLMLYDLKSGESWPHASPSESFENQKTRGLKLLEKLQAEQPARALKLGDLQCGG